jgi:hypothetical protein
LREVVVTQDALKASQARRNSARSMSRPAKNISNNLPSSAIKSAIGRSMLKKPRTYGPTMTPPSSRPTAAGTCRRRQNLGMVTSITIPSANFASTGSVTR